jgi:glutathione S-transferase
MSMSGPNTDQDDDFLPLMDLKPMRASSIKSGPLGVVRVIVGLFSGTGVRDPPRTTDKEDNSKDNDNPRKKMQHVRLITIAASHYCEKARWGLDMLEADPDNKSEFYYTEDGHPPAFAAFATVPASKDQASATPMIVFPDGRFLCQSDIILKEFCPFLYPDEISNQIEDWELDMGIRLGAAIRLYLYHRFLDPSKEYYPALTDFLCLHCSKVEKILFGAMLDKGIDKGIRNAMNISDTSAEKSKEMVRQVFAQVSVRLQQSGGDYLMDSGNTGTPATKFGFTAADLTFAALVYPLMRPPEMSHFLIAEDDRFPPDVIAFCRELRETKAGKHALKMYAQHRPVSPSDGKVVMKSCGRGRDRMPWKELGYLVGVVGALALAVRMVGVGRPGR